MTLEKTIKLLKDLKSVLEEDKELLRKEINNNLEPDIYIKEQYIKDLDFLTALYKATTILENIWRIRKND